MVQVSARPASSHTLTSSHLIPLAERLSWPVPQLRWLSAMAMMAGAVCSQRPCTAAFSRYLDNSCSTSSGSVSAALQSAPVLRVRLGGVVGQGRRSMVLGASALSSMCSSFRGRHCLVLSWPTGVYHVRAREE